jgi:hypothetical protein
VLRSGVWTHLSGSVYVKVPLGRTWRLASIVGWPKLPSDLATRPLDVHVQARIDSDRENRGRPGMTPTRSCTSLRQ